MNTLKFISVFSIALLIAACGSSEQTTDENKDKKEPPREQYLEQIKTMEAEMFKSEVVNPETANKAIKAYSDYALNFPNDTISAHYLFKAGEVATANKQFTQAMIYYENIEKTYPDFVHCEAALYLQAYLFDYLINDDAKAKTVYERLMQKYPTSHYVDDAKAAIANLGKTDEQLIEEFKKKNGQK